ncbi:MAG: PQQ-dependent sugar dehydrogenase [Bacteroidales bacterium]|nr:PQQ-dependent sugar dehydrogenase [Bacteroidales bacterium]
MKTLQTFVSYIILSFLVIGCSKKSESQLYIGSTAIDTNTIVSNLDTPWEILWGPDNYIWFTERAGRINRLNPETGENQLIVAIPEVYEFGEAGLLGMALHPDFDTEPYIYLVYNFLSGEFIKERLVRYIWNGSTLEQPVILINNIPGNSYHDGSRILFGPDGKLYMSTGDAGNLNSPQNMNSLAGKILRINPDGSIPEDNPNPGSYIWALGLRNSQGLVFSPEGRLYGSEHGPSNDDELNLLESGRNYGWPDVAGFCNLPAEITFCDLNNVREPLTAWTPTLAVAGIDFYNHMDIPEWQNSILMTTLKAGKLVSLRLSSDGLSVTEQADWFTGEWGRLRDICISPDGRVFLAVSNRDGRGTPVAGDDRIIEIKVAGPTGLSVQHKKSGIIKIIPNPVSPETKVVINEEYVGSGFTIISHTGQIISAGKISQTQFMLDTGNLKPGYYIFQVSGQVEPVSEPFIVL